MNVERRDLNSPKKITLHQLVLKKFAFSFAFNLRKQNVTDFFDLFNRKLCAVPLNYDCRVLYVSPRGINDGLSDNSCLSVPLPSHLLEI